MGIIERDRRRAFRQVQSFSSAAVLTGAVFVSAPKAPGSATIVYSTPSATGNVSWFNTSNWFNGGTATGTLPESAISSSVVGINIDSPNIALPTTGILFDPANQIGNSNYLANTVIPASQGGPSGTFYISDSNSSGTEISAPNKLTVDSGTLEGWLTIIGRDSSAMLTQNGGTVLVDELKIGDAHNVASTATNFIQGSGTYAYHGGSLIVKNQVLVGGGNNIFATDTVSPEVGKFVIYNDGVDGAISLGPDLHLAANSLGTGTVGIVEFHYDVNQNAVGNVRPIQISPSPTSPVSAIPSSLILSNTTNQLSELNLVVDSAVSMVGGHPQNLGLFKENTIVGTSTFPTIFYATDGVTGYTQGATVSAILGNTVYSWTISYSGVISFTNTATSTYTVTSAIGGNDVVLVAVPEPTTVALLSSVGSLILARRKKRI